MKAGAKLGAYAVTLTVVFGGAWSLGTIVNNTGADQPSAAPSPPVHAEGVPPSNWPDKGADHSHPDPPLPQPVPVPTRRQTSSASDIGQRGMGNLPTSASRLPGPDTTNPPVNPTPPTPVPEPQEPPTSPTPPQNPPVPPSPACDPANPLIPLTCTAAHLAESVGL